MFKSYEAFVVAHGKGYESAALSEAERTHVKSMLDEHRAWWRRGFAYNHCFVYSQELMSFDKTGKLVYVEGYVWAYGDRLPPMHHGWLTLHGKVIDVTVVTRAIAHPDTLPPEPLQVQGEFEDRAYFGVPFLRSHFKFRRSLNRGHGRRGGGVPTAEARRGRGGPGGEVGVGLECRPRPVIDGHPRGTRRDFADAARGGGDD